MCGQSTVNRLFASVLMCLRLSLVVYNRLVLICTRRMEELSRLLCFGVHWICVCVWESSGYEWSLLMKISFSGCSTNSWEQTSVTDVGLKCLATLPNLVYLSMSYLANVSDTALEAIASRGKLRKLTCRGCPSFTDVGCIRYFSSSSEYMFSCALVFCYTLIVHSVNL